MSKSWVSLVIIGVIIVLVVISWDVILTFAGAKADYQFNITPMQAELFGGVEEHLKADPEFGK